ncbi:hypothetical protein M4951_22275 [Blastopirellula sp. J2-11]|uniref:hypothetical protein n=1 Tax=Blastopirellula sp. J2-11 TaxID=2943192 RepID=UPI0021C5FC8F|nr:hypothetical protein [Blastopirellula sp. J2-11]UUO06074.1 hypothetical protein M4951_22275 [Blastopirellula sp. J2-11]
MKNRTLSLLHKRRLPLPGLSSIAFRHLISSAMIVAFRSAKVAPRIGSRRIDTAVLLWFRLANATFAERKATISMPAKKR